jgi:hypothetical protein
MTERVVAIGAVIAVALGVTVALMYRPDSSEVSNTVSDARASAETSTFNTETRTNARPDASATSSAAAHQEQVQPTATITTAAEFEAMFVKDPSIGTRNPDEPDFVKEYMEKVRLIAPITADQERALHAARNQYLQQWNAAISSSGVLNPELPLGDRRRALDYTRNMVVRYSDNFLESVRHKFLNEAQFELLRQLQHSEYKRQLRELRYEIGLND